MPVSILAKSYSFAIGKILLIYLKSVRLQFIYNKPDLFIIFYF